MGDIRTHYLDASAITKLLIREDGSDAIRQYCGIHSVFATTAICFAETLGALKTKYLRDLLSRDEYLSACDELMAYLRDSTLQIEDVDISDQQTFAAVEVLVKKYPIDISDAYQIVTLKQGSFSQFGGGSRPMLITADEALAKAALAEGALVWDCLREPAP